MGGVTSSKIVKAAALAARKARQEAPLDKARAAKSSGARRGATGNDRPPADG